MIRIAGSDDYLAALLEAIRPGAEKVLSYYDHRVGLIGTDPRLMLMPWDDHIVHRGDGVFETAKFVDRKIYQLDAHLKRMRQSAEAIHLTPPCGWDEVRRIVIETSAAADKSNGMVRVLLGRGPGGFGIDPFECPVPSLYVVCYALHLKPESFFEAGVSAFKSSIPAKQSYLATIKTINYLPNVLMKHEAVTKGMDYPLCFDQGGFLAEGATENVCIVDAKGRLAIPEFTNALAGTTTMRAVDLVKHEIDVVFRGITESELYDAKEIILVGTSIDALSVVRFNGKPVHDARPGPVSRRMRQLLREDLKKNGVPF